MSRRKNKITTRKGFSLIELVIVVVIIAIIGAIAIPRMSRGAAGASDSALSGDLNILRSAIDLYASEHNGTYPALSTVTAQLTEFTDDTGDTSTTKDSTHIYGPYLRTVPTLPVGPATYKGTDTFVDGSSGNPGDNAGAWFYNASTGSVQANLADDQTDAKSVKYNTY
ncbi:MAG TPA: prepilin-type N-terminal cleavage/methylation domain-containing protein [Tepidisphaeraceae bacterium]|nr:prepilin-type N-terminal cleavage/methylation domain-containing protein [Tepidisphaeraceae bacterium]